MQSTMSFGRGNELRRLLFCAFFSVWARNRPPEFLDIEATADLNAVRSVKFARDAC